MRIALLNLTGGGMSGGHRKYLLNILPHLASSEKISAILCAAPESLGVRDWLPRIEKVSLAPCEPFRPFVHSPGSMLKKALDAFAPDLLFIPVERYINYKNLPVVVMLQNMAPLTGTKTGAGPKEWLQAVARRYETRYALKRAAAVIAPTSYVKDFLVSKEGVSPGKISVARYGSSPIGGAAVPPAASRLLREGFIFTAGSLEMYRGIEDIIRALPGVKTQFPGIKLAIAGGSRPETEGYASSLKKLAAGLGVEGDLVWLGNLPEAELSWCYSNCSVFVLTSRAEAFCFVALEAMQHGCRIVSTDNSCLPEVLGERAVYYKAGGYDALAGLIAAELRAKYARPDGETLKRANLFSWAVTAGITMDAIVAARSAPSAPQP